jgi:hypothetical protein
MQVFCAFFLQRCRGSKHDTALLTVQTPCLHITLCMVCLLPSDAVTPQHLCPAATCCMSCAVAHTAAMKPYTDYIRMRGACTSSPSFAGHMLHLRHILEGGLTA